MLRCVSLLLLLLVATTDAFQVALSRRLLQPTLSPPLRTICTLRMANNADDKVFASTDELIVSTSKGLGRVSWLSWWSQVILTVVSSVTLLFARNVLLSSKGSSNTIAAPGFVFAGTGTNTTMYFAL